MKATMFIVPANKDIADTTGSTFVASSQDVVKEQNEAITSFNIDSNAKIVYGELIAHVIFSSNGSDNWAVDGLPKKLIGTHKFPTLWPVRYFENTKSGDQITFIINGCHVTVTAGVDETPGSLAPTFQDGIADILAHKEFVESLMASNAANTNCTIDYLNTHPPYDLPKEYQDDASVGGGSAAGLVDVEPEVVEPVDTVVEEVPVVESDNTVTSEEIDRKKINRSIVAGVGTVLLACAAAYFIFKK